MLLQEPNLSVWFYAKPVDMRNQFDGLAALAKSKLKRPANSGELFVFINKRSTYIKILYYAVADIVYGANGLSKVTFIE